MDFLRARLITKPAIVRMCVARLVLELLLDPLSLIGFVAQLRAADRGTDQGEVYARFGELRSDLLVLDLVQTERHGTQTPPFVVPAFRTGNILN